MIATAKARHQRISPRKARVFMNAVRGKDALEALYLLKSANKPSAGVVIKLIESAIANAGQKAPASDLDALRIVKATADKAPNRFMRRWRPRAQGRATPIAKGMSHLEIGLA